MNLLALGALHMHGRCLDLPCGADGSALEPPADTGAAVWAWQCTMRHDPGGQRRCKATLSSRTILQRLQPLMKDKGTSEGDLLSVAQQLLGTPSRCTRPGILSQRGPYSVQTSAGRGQPDGCPPPVSPPRWNRFQLLVGGAAGAAPLEAAETAGDGARALRPPPSPLRPFDPGSEPADQSPTQPSAMDVDAAAAQAVAQMADASSLAVPAMDRTLFGSGASEIGSEANEAGHGSSAALDESDAQLEAALARLWARWVANPASMPEPIARWQAAWVDRLAEATATLSREPSQPVETAGRDAPVRSYAGAVRRDTRPQPATNANAAAAGGGAPRAPPGDRLARMAEWLRPARMPRRLPTLRAVYVGNFKRGRLGALRQTLRDCGVPMRPVANICYVSSDIVEFLVDGEHVESFLDSFRGTGFRHLPDYDLRRQRGRGHKDAEPLAAATAALDSRAGAILKRFPPQAQPAVLNAWGARQAEGGRIEFVPAAEAAPATAAAPTADTAPASAKPAGRRRRRPRGRQRPAGEARAASPAADADVVPDLSMQDAADQSATGETASDAAVTAAAADTAAVDAGTASVDTSPAEGAIPRAEAAVSPAGPPAPSPDAPPPAPEPTAAQHERGGNGRPVRLRRPPPTVPDMLRGDAALAALGQPVRRRKADAVPSGAARADDEITAFFRRTGTKRPPPTPNASFVRDGHRPCLDLDGGSDGDDNDSDNDHAAGDSDEQPARPTTSPTSPDA